MDKNQNNFHDHDLDPFFEGHTRSKNVEKWPVCIILPEGMAGCQSKRGEWGHMVLFKNLSSLCRIYSLCTALDDSKYFV